MPRASKRARAGTAADAEPATAAPAHTAFPADRGWTRWTTTWRWGVLRCVGEFLRREGLAEAATVLERECRRLPAGSAEGGTGDALGLFTTSGAAVDGGDGQPPAPVCSCCQEPAGVSGRIGVGVAMAGDLDALFVGAAILYGARRALAVDADDADALLDMLEEAAQMRRRRRLRYRFSEQEWATEARSRRRSSMTTANGAAGGCEETDVTTSERPRSRRKKQSQPRRTRRGRDNASAGVARFVEPIRDRLPDSSGDEEDAAGKGERGEVAPAVDGGRSHSTASVNDFAWLPSTARAGEARASVDNESMPEWMAQLAGTIAERINREHGDTRATAATAAAAGLETGAASAPAPPPPIAADAALEAQLAEYLLLQQMQRRGEQAARRRHTSEAPTPTDNRGVAVSVQPAAATEAASVGDADVSRRALENGNRAHTATAQSSPSTTETAPTSSVLQEKREKLRQLDIDAFLASKVKYVDASAPAGS
ncbi:hypothetical protein CDCA_CDCA03G0895 [Cyanidium caldarium]|uniref:LisH domain-containing protein n=1 Tax=Cyanidium caldarium TaxID=2771 RepID=A0AAV9IRZ4_CYACA|nr:hypothetical protein CDCA_CDCA03G0895 [Cyanidium caldarium]